MLNFQNLQGMNKESGSDCWGLATTVSGMYQCNIITRSPNFESLILNQPFIIILTTVLVVSLRNASIVGLVFASMVSLGHASIVIMPENFLAIPGDNLQCQS